MSSEQIVPGILIDSSGQASVDASLSDVLFDLALKLEGPTGLPVDVEHIVAAVVLAVRNGHVDRLSPLTADDSTLTDILTVHVKTVFAAYGGSVGADD